MGWSTTVTPFRSTGTCQALTDGEVLSIARRDLLRLIQGDAQLGEKLMKKIGLVVQQRMRYVTGENPA